jgi:hypothetical protein
MDDGIYIVTSLGLHVDSMPSNHDLIVYNDSNQDVFYRMRETSSNSIGAILRPGEEFIVRSSSCLHDLKFKAEEALDATVRLTWIPAEARLKWNKS